MDELMDLIMKAAMKGNISGSPAFRNQEVKPDIKAMSQKSAENIWEVYQAHIEVGFTPDQAMQIVIALLGKK